MLWNVSSFSGCEVSFQVLASVYSFDWNTFRQVLCQFQLTAQEGIEAVNPIMGI